MFRVQWARAALEELATVWTDSDSAGRRAITSATRTIDELLCRDPKEQGESRGESERITFVPPLGVTYDIDVNNSVVRVLQIWKFRPHS